jgi:hypothetical protein
MCLEVVAWLALRDILAQPSCRLQLLFAPVINGVGVVRQSKLVSMSDRYFQPSGMNRSFWEQTEYYTITIMRAVNRVVLKVYNKRRGHGDGYDQV